MPIAFVADFQGKLIPKDKARRIKDETGKYNYYEENVSCIRMEDGLWYRTTTGKIVYDWSKKKWVFLKGFAGHSGIVEDGSIGSYSDISKEVVVCLKKDCFAKKTVFDPYSKNLQNLVISDKKWNKFLAQSEQAAVSLGFVESINDGIFYKLDDCSTADLEKMQTPSIPQNERSQTYSLDDDRDYRSRLEDLYDKNTLSVSKDLMVFARKYIPYSMGFELEVQNGFVPARIREPLGFRTCRDGSLGEGSQQGIEYVSIPTEGGKGLQALKNMCTELSKRCVISNKCSVHTHFGGVRRDKLYVVSLWKVLTMIQNEFRKYFPYSRTNTIRNDGKIYANLLPDIGLTTKDMLKIKEDKPFRKRVNDEFQKIYTYLNHGHPLGEVYDEVFMKDTRTKILNGVPELQHCYRIKKFSFTTKLPRHAVQGHKWQRQERYMWCNLLNMFFSNSGTVEMRIHEASTNFDKILLLICISVAILKYAENFDKVLTINSLDIKTILKDHYPEEIVRYLLKYLESRRSRFCNVNEGFKSAWKDVEEAWFDGDKKYKFDATPIYQIKQLVS